ncbi:MAG: acyltransferase [Desulfotalea sp.]
MINKENKSHYRSEIDGLRALAIIAVIINHFESSLLPGGFLGVDIFFVISGFVITQSLTSREHTSFSGFLIGFYERRIKRLAPALIFFVTIMSFLGILFIEPEAEILRNSIKTGIFSLFGFSNIFLFNQATDYFGSSAELNLFTHTWSLGVEEQFYFIFPLIFGLTGCLQRNKSYKTLLFVLAALSIISLSCFFMFSSVASFYLIPARFWELAMGVISFFIYLKVKGRVGSFFPVLALLVILSCFFLSPSYSMFSTVAIVFATMVLLFGLKQNTLLYNIFTLKILTFIGLISYSLYLWHWGIIAIGRWTVGVSGFWLFLQITLVFILATFSYYFIEQPFRHKKWSCFLKFKELSVGIITICIVASIILLGTNVFKSKLYLGKNAILEKKGAATLQNKYSYMNKLSWSGSDCVLASASDVGKAIDVGSCTIGNTETAAKRFLVIGDSFSAAELEMFAVIAKSDLGAVTVTSSWDASPVSEIENTGSWKSTNEYYWHTVIPALVEELDAGDVLIMINDGSQFCPGESSKELTELLGSLEKGLDSLASQLETKGVSVLYQTANPFLRDSQCAPDTALRQWWHRENEPPCIYFSREETLKRRKSYDKILSLVSKKNNNFYVLDLIDVLCPGEICRFYNEEGVFLYRDEYSHMSVEASRLAQPILLEHLEAIIDNK